MTDVAAAGQAPRHVEVAIVGGGPAGAALAIRLATAGVDVAVLERAAAWRWRAGGVFTTPATLRELAALGLPAELLDRVARRIPAMRLETRRGTAVRLTYGDDGSLRAAAAGLDRSALDPALLAEAAARGAAVRAGVTVTAIDPSGGTGGRPLLTTRSPAGPTELRADLVVGADGIGSTMAGLLGQARRAPIGRRIGLTTHLAEGSPAMHDARMVVIDGGYCGIAPVPAGRVNVGIVLAGRVAERRLARMGATRLLREVVAGLAPDDARGSDAWRTGAMCDPVAGAVPLGHAVRRLAGDQWLLIGDAAGFLDPFTGEGLHRALVSSRLAADAILEWRAGRVGALAVYERRYRARFRTKDAVSRLVQAFLARPMLFEYAATRLARRPAVRETMGLVMGDLAPAQTALDPRFLAALLRP